MTAPAYDPVIVTGGSRGLGLALVRRLLAEGARVATLSRKRTPMLEELLGDPATGDRLYYREVDMAAADGLRSYVADVVAKFGPPQALVNNAALAYEGVLATASPARMTQVIDVNLSGLILMTRECVRKMLPERRGRIVNITSIMGLRGYSGLAAYSAAKAGVIGFTRSLARELGPAGIRVNAVAPGYLRTEMSETLGEAQIARLARRTPLRRLGDLDDVWPVVRFLLSDDSAFMTGQVLTVDGGMTC